MAAIIKQTQGKRKSSREQKKSSRSVRRNGKGLKYSAAPQAYLSINLLSALLW